MILAHLALSVLPVLGWLFWVYRRDRYEPEPIRQVLKVYIAGALITIPAGLWNAAGGALLGTGLDASTLHDAALMSFLVIGPGEELLKLGVVYLLIYRRPDFNEPIDGLVYTGAAALGFASLENLLYASEMGAAVIPLRLVTAVPGHFLMAAIYGYALGVTVTRGHRVPAHRRIVRAWLSAALAHGAYDFCLLGGAATGNGYLTLGAFVILIMLAYRYRAYVRALNQASPFHPSRRGAACRSCGNQAVEGSRFCEQCGVPLGT